MNDRLKFRYIFKLGEQILSLNIDLNDDPYLDIDSLIELLQDKYEEINPELIYDEIEPVKKLQCTGIKDTSDELCYDKDKIIVDTKNRILSQQILEYVIVYRDDNGAWVFEDPTVPFVLGCTTTKYLNDYDFKIIGNIHEI
jgi:hypothetical protein